jgi:hypothetical protein
MLKMLAGALVFLLMLAPALGQTTIVAQNPVPVTSSQEVYGDYSRRTASQEGKITPGKYVNFSGAKPRQFVNGAPLPAEGMSISDGSVRWSARVSEAHALIPRLTVVNEVWVPEAKVDKYGSLHSYKKATPDIGTGGWDQRLQRIIDFMSTRSLKSSQDQDAIYLTPDTFDARRKGDCGTFVRMFQMLCGMEQLDCTMLPGFFSGYATRNSEGEVISLDSAGFHVIAMLKICGRQIYVDPDHLRSQFRGRNNPLNGALYHSIAGITCIQKGMYFWIPEDPVRFVQVPQSVGYVPGKFSAGPVSVARD